MIDDLVIIVPTFNRPDYLRRVVRYYSSFPCRVYICDSSAEDAGIKSDGNIIYRWAPEKNFNKKVLDTVEETSADFYALSPDDDFIKEETLMECLTFMRNHTDHSLAGGKQVFFKEGLGEGFYSTDSMNRMHGINEIPAEPKEDYVRYFWSHYQNILWSVFKKKAIRDAFAALNSCNYDNGNFVELSLGLESLRNGRIYISSNALNFREIITREHWGSTTPTISRDHMKSEPALAEDIRRFHDYYRGDPFAEFCLDCHLDAAPRESLLERMTKRIPVSVRKSFLFAPLRFASRLLTRSKKTAAKDPVFPDDVMEAKIAQALK